MYTTDDCTVYIVICIAGSQYDFTLACDHFKLPKLN